MTERPTTPSQAEIDEAMARARRLHALAFGDVFTWLAEALRRRARAVRGAFRTAAAGMSRLLSNVEMARVAAVNPERTCPQG